MSYLALYRKWRPKTFNEVVGQQHVVKTLTNALKTSRTSHAYLFCGSRGTGKTSMAKILAKALNCTDLQNGEPCNRCSNCLKIESGIFMDILEIDAASNRGIDEIRELREKIKLAPAEGLYKVYIIDEVHMLTQEAFNALLKTLEEPPKHVVFILATTEPHKIPLTILSRCQRFDFHRIPVEEIVVRLEEITGDIGIEVDKEALYLIARLSAGGLRDALGLLDQCLNFTENKLSADYVAQVAGVAGDEFMYSWTEHILSGETARVLLMLQEALNKGKQAKQLLSDLINYWRNLLVLRLEGDTRDMVPAQEELILKMEQQGRKIDVDKLLSSIRTMATWENEMKYSGNEQILLEVSLIKLMEELGKVKLPEREIPTEIYIEEKLSDEVMTDRRDDQEAMETAGDTFVEVLPCTEEFDAGPVEDILGEIDDAYPQEETSSNLLMQNEDPIKSSIDIHEVWEKLLAEMQKQRIMARAFVVEGEPKLIDESHICLEFDPKYEFHKNRMDKAENKVEIETLLKEITGKKISLSCGFIEEDKKDVESITKEKKTSLVEHVEEIFGKDKVFVIKEE